MSVPSDSSGPRLVLKANGPGRPPWARAATWAVGLTAAVLVTVSIGGYWYHRGQLKQIAARHVRLRVTGPARLHAAVEAKYTVTTTAITGDPVAAQVKFAVYPPGEKHPSWHHETTDEDGRLEVTVSGKDVPASGAVLKVVVQHGDTGETEETETRLAVEPARYATQLVLDKPLYRPGETVQYRTLTLSRFGLAADHQLPVHCEVLDPNGAALADSQRDIATQRSVGNGAFTLPGELIGGEYILVARSPQRAFLEQQRRFFVYRLRPPQLGQELEVAVTGVDAHDVEVSFYPEGGDLAAGLENRVYFVSRNPQGEPVHVKGRLVDGQGNEVAVVETMHQGMGWFRFTPRKGQQYFLKITSPAGVAGRPKLPQVSARRKIVLTTGTGVFDADGPLEFNVRAAQSGVPLVVAAWCRGVQVGQQTLVTRFDGEKHNGANPVVIPLAEEVGGVIRLTVFDYRTSPPRPVAERLVYRKMGRTLHVHAATAKRSYAPGEEVRVSLSVTNEKDEPVAATLGAAVVDDALLSLAGPPNVSTHFLLSAEVERPQDLDDADFYLSDDPEAATALDLLLATQGWRRFAEKTVGQFQEEGREDSQLARLVALGGSAHPPAMFDNLAKIRSKYERALAEYRQERIRLLITLTALSFFGGLGLLLLVVMLGLLKVVSGVHLWGPALGAAACCVIVGLLLMDPTRLEPQPAAAFASFHPQLPEAAMGKDRAGSSQALDAPDADDPQRTAEETGEETAARLRRRVAVREYARRTVGDQSGAQGELATTLFWQPMLLADAQGRASISFDLPESITTFRLQVDAHGGGRLGSGEVILRTTSAPEANPSGARPLPAESRPAVAP